LEYIFQPNAKDRGRDIKYLDYVNLSITQINSWFFSRSAGSWHKFSDLWWCVLSFTPEILEHEGVIFTTTNNIYSGVKRATGAAGLEAAFAKNIHQYQGNYISRPDELPHNMTTCNQAEVLYPGEISTRYLKTIYVRNEDTADELAGQFGAVNHVPVEIQVKAELFRELG
ncbi:MAG: DarT ssDNA thymidine ADP-ribosyltransferase family protein, partial [Sideroxyarcus sp.]|nr:DarT ssDNA thymidine ADP-ribosyltransferase family protein [Sideroxyarcus sp.]